MDEKTEQEQNEIWWKDAQAPKREKIAILLANYRDAKEELQPMMDSLDELAETIKRLTLELGEDVETEAGSATIRKGYARTSWDGKALSGYAAAHPEIKQFSKLSVVKPTVVLKAKQ